MPAKKKPTRRGKFTYGKDDITITKQGTGKTITPPKPKKRAKK